ncbi:ABC transporter substrate-binding protein [Loktanella agnita]|uniref:ABC transporter substrate-binding protein n=1 Tax=Loktanella agnita TaxID=287097 RepID=UPI00398854BB
MKTQLIAMLIIMLGTCAFAQEFPLTITHKFGETVIESAPVRVASLDYNGADNLLALGIQPVTIRDWYGDHPKAVWPWAAPLLMGNPEILRGDLNFEQIAAAEPDVIIALWSGITTEEYTQLSRIAPVVAVPEGTGDFALPWDQLALIAGEATGKLDLAETLVQGVNDELAAIRARHPDWQGRTASPAYVWNGLGVYTGKDIRTLLLANLGLITPAAVQDISAEGEFVASFSQEELPIIDADVVLWFTDGSEDNIQSIEDLALRPALTAYHEGREIFVDAMLSSAMSHASLLSLPYALEALEPKIAAAIDGDPATLVPE